MSKITNEIAEFIKEVDRSHKTLNFLYNLNNNEFDEEKDTIYYSKPW